MMANSSGSQDDVDPKQDKKRAGGPDDSRGASDGAEEPIKPVNIPRAGGPDDSRSG